MKWVGNNLIDDKNKFLVGYDESNDWCNGASITVYDENLNIITYDDLTDWEFSQFPQLYAQCDYSVDEIKIVNKKLGITGRVIIECENNGDHSAHYYSEKIG